MTVLARLLVPANPVRQAIGAAPIIRLDARKKPGARRRNRAVRLGDRPRVPTAQIAQAAAFAERVAAAAHKALAARLKPYATGEGVIDAETAARIARELKAELAGTPSKSSALAAAKSALVALDTWNRRDVARTLGVPVPRLDSRVLRLDDVGPRGSDGSGPWRAEWIRDYADRLRSLEGDARERFVGYLEEVGERGMRVETLQRRLAENEELSARKARFIARDSILTLNARFTRDRHEAAGVTEYEWLCIDDGSSRSHHVELDGKRFSYDDPPVGGGTGPDDVGNPGEGRGCRCQAVPVIPEYLAADVEGPPVEPEESAPSRPFEGVRFAAREYERASSVALEYIEVGRDEGLAPAKSLASYVNASGGVNHYLRDLAEGAARNPRIDQEVANIRRALADILRSGGSVSGTVVRGEVVDDERWRQLLTSETVDFANFVSTTTSTAEAIEFAGEGRRAFMTIRQEGGVPIGGIGPFGGDSKEVLLEPGRFRVVSRVVDGDDIHITLERLKS